MIKDRLYFLIVSLLSLVPLVALLQPGLPLTHDGQDHVIRTANFFQNLLEGNIIPRWSANVNYGFGHPILIFFYPLPYYVSSFFHILGFSFIDSTKLFFGITYILSGWTMYLFVKELFGKKEGVVSAVLYLMAPYRFVDLYVRGAIGEHASFLFPPLILFFILRLAKTMKMRYLIGIALSLAGLILCHNATSLMFLPFILFFMLYKLRDVKEKKKYLVLSGLAIVLAFGMSAFFWMPAMLEAKYTLRNIVTKGEYAHHFVDPVSLIQGAWNYGGSGEFSVQIGYVHIFFLITSFVLFCISLTKRKKDLLLLGLILYSMFAIFIMFPTADVFWKKLLLMQNFQFPWRFLSILVFTTAVLGGLVIRKIQIKYQQLATVLCVVFLLFISKDFWSAKDYIVQPDTFFAKVQRTTTNDTGESSPIWSVRFMEERPNGPVEIIDGTAQIQLLKRSIAKHSYGIQVKERARIRENTLYFPGWYVYIDGKQSQIEFQDPKNRGIMTFFVEKGEHNIDIIFQETKLRKLADILSIGSVMSIVFFMLLGVKKLWRLSL